MSGEMKEIDNTEKDSDNPDMTEKEKPLRKVVKIIMWLMGCDILIEFRPRFESQGADILFLCVLAGTLVGLTWYWIIRPMWKSFHDKIKRK